jgi:hypothetical protein
MSEERHASFVIRVVQDRQGQISGVIERVATGAKEAFTSKEVIGGVIARMLQREKALPRTNPGPPPDDGEKSTEPS